MKTQTPYKSLILLQRWLLQHIKCKKSGWLSTLQNVQYNQTTETVVPDHVDNSSIRMRVYPNLHDRDDNRNDDIGSSISQQYELIGAKRDHKLKKQDEKTL